MRQGGGEGGLTARRLLALGVGLSLFLLASWALSSMLGTVELSPQVWRLRAARGLAAVLVGGALAVGGASLQGLLRNPLADPYVLGIASGAGLGVMLGRLAPGELPLRALSEPSLALLGGLLSAGLVYLVARREGRVEPLALILAGVIVNLWNGALVLLLFLLATPEQIADYVGWGMGRVPEWLLLRPGLAGTAALAVFGGWGLLFFRASALNALELGDEVAASLGVPVRRLRVEVFGAVSLLTAAAVALAGPVGFVGLIVPHACRFLLGSDHRVLVLASGLLGGAALLWADTGCRLLGPALGLGALPVGVLTALLGGPFFLYLLRRGGGRA